MEDYRLQQSGQEVQSILNGAAMQVDLTSEESRAKAAEKQNADDIDAIEEKIPSGASSSNKFATESDVNDASQTLQGNIDAEALRAGQAEQVLDGKIDAEETRAKAAEKANADDIDAIEEKIPSGASSSNKLATEDYVNNKVATDSATFRGTYNLVSNLGLLPTATHDQIAYALSGEIATADNNDYAYVQIPTSAETPTEIAKIERYKFDGSAWAFEYELNNSGFTAAQWAAINSGITSGDVTKLAALPTSSELTTLLNGKQDTLTFDNVPTQGSNNPVKSGGVYSGIKAEEERAKAAEKLNADNIEAIEEKIPSGASSSNKMATASDISSLDAAIEAIMLLIPSAATSLNKLTDKSYVDSSIATATATFRGTYNLVNDLSLTISATHAQIATALGGAVSDEDNNDYAFVQIPTSDATPTQIAKTERYKFNGTAWEYEYDLNNSGYTAAQWAAINSGITEALVMKLSALPTNADLTTALGVLTEGIAAINAKIPSDASSSNKMVDTAAMQSYITHVLDTIDATFNVTSTDGHVTVQITQVNGVITNVAVTTSDIASAADLSLLAGRVTTAEGNISTNTEDISELQDLYNALQQSEPVIIEPTDTWPVTNPSTKTIYRVVDRVNTPPQYYSDYMWNGTTMVLMAQYNNAIDPRPKKGSQNLVTSGGVFDNMGALDVSELNATENPHTLATYADLSAAIAAIPSDYQKGGMSIKFVQSSDNKYIQARCMAQNFTTDVTQWQKVVDETKAGSKDIITSGGVYSALEKTSEISKEGSSTEVDAIIIKDENNNEVFKVDENGLDAKNVKSNGNDVLTSADIDIDSINDKTSEIEVNRNETTEVDEIIIKDENNNEVFKVDENGLDAKNVKSNGNDVLTSADIDIDSINDKTSEIEVNHYETTDEEIAITDNNGVKVASIDKDGLYANRVTSKDINVEASLTEDEEIAITHNETPILRVLPDGVRTANPKDINGNNLKVEYGYFESAKVSPISKEKPLVYVADTKVSSNHIVNAVAFDNGEIIACRAGGNVVKIANDGTESVLLHIDNVGEWRLCWKDSNNNVYVSPHGSFGGSVALSDRGLYRLANGGSQFVKVLELYNPSSSDTPVTQNNDDTIWTMCEDCDGYLYAGVYCHSVRYAPRLYRSTDGGTTWVDYHNFLPDSPGARHVHCIEYNQYNNALYCILGEVNTVYKSTDKGNTWTDLNTPCEGAKGTTLTPVKDGIIIGSDSAYECIMSKLYSDDVTVKSKSAIWADIVFAVRVSDVTGWIYAFCRVDSSVNVTDYMPPLNALTSASALEDWIESDPSHLSDWEDYRERVKDFYPDDSIRPTHFAIQRSQDNGETWEVIYRESIPGTNPDGVISAGWFKNGECLCSRYIGGQPVNPLVISESKHKYTQSGIDLSGEIFSKTLNNNIL